MASPANADLIQKARAGDQQALGELLLAHNKLLTHLAQQELSPQLRGRLSVSDLVQQTCLSAIRNFDQFQGEDIVALAGWLKAVQRRNIQDAVRRHVAANKRAVSRQQNLGEPEALAAEQLSVSRHVMLGESAAQLQQALTHLPADQAEAVRLRHLEQLSLREIATQMDRSEVAVAALLKRGLMALRRHFPPEN